MIPRLNTLRYSPMPTYPGGGPQVTVDTALSRPAFIARAIANLVPTDYVSETVFARGTAQQVAGGSANYNRSETRYMDRDPERVEPRSGFPRAGWTVAQFQAAVRKYGLEVPIADESRRRNALDELGRAQIRLANSLVKFVDGVAMALFLADTGVATLAGSGDWTSAGDPITDIATARQMIRGAGEGFVGDTLIIKSAQELDLIKNANLRAVLPREGDNIVTTGRVVPVLGLRNIVVTDAPTLPDGTAILAQANVVGTIADEAPIAGENYVSYNPGGGFAPVYVKVYREEGADETIVRAARFPAMWIAEPKAAIKITGI